MLLHKENKSKGWDFLILKFLYKQHRLTFHLILYMQVTTKITTSDKTNLYQEPKDRFIGTTLTLRKLQKKNIIPAQLTPISLNTEQIRHPKPTPATKYLLSSNRNIIYFGQVNSQGFPESNNGVFIYSDGSYYQGNIKNGKPDGQGKITNIQGSYWYIGSWKKGLPEGEGKQMIGNNMYEGEFFHGKKNGRGKLLYEDGSYYEGQFQDNAIQGQGKYCSKNNFWQGTWKNGYMQGKGRQIISKNNIKTSQDIEQAIKNIDSSIYIGEFVKGEKSGFGNFKWNKNYEYEGSFDKGQLHGQGTFKFKGKVYAGVWSNGTEVKIAQLRRGVSSVTLKGSIRKDGNIVLSNEGITESERSNNFKASSLSKKSNTEVLNTNQNSKVMDANKSIRGSNES